MAESLFEHSEDGTVKLYVIAAALGFRAEHHAVFENGEYTPLEGSGPKAEYVTAFARAAGNEQIIAVAPRLPVGLTNDLMRPPVGQDVWDGTWLALPEGQKPGTRYRNIFTDEVIKAGVQEGQPGLPLALVLGHFPVALLERIK